MRKYLTISSIFVLFPVAFIVLAGFSVAYAATSASTFSYGVWLPFWKAQDGAQDVSLNLDKLSEVSPFSYEIGSAGKIIDDAKINNGSWDAWFSSAHELKVKIIPTIAWFDGTGMYNLLSNTKSRQAHEDAIAALAKSQQFDGIDIDYENKFSKTIFFTFYSRACDATARAKGNIDLHGGAAIACDGYLGDAAESVAVFRRLYCAQ